MHVNKLKLTRNLRRDVLRGHPWLYQSAFEELPKAEDGTQVKVFDKTGKFLCWGMYNPSSAIAVRVLSLKDKFHGGVLAERIQLARSLRFGLPSSKTNAFRLINGEGDSLPGLVCDVYNGTAVVQYDGEGCARFWATYPLAKILESLSFVEQVVFKGRGKNSNLEFLTPQKKEIFPSILENGMVFKVDIEKGQKTGFFLDQRDNRKYVSSQTKNKTVLNCFSYTGGFSVAAGFGGAKHVTSMDISEKALSLATENWNGNGFPPENHLSEAQDIYEFMKTNTKTWDVVLVDPPSMAKSEDQKSAAISKYTHLFADAAKAVRPGGDLMLSSCSSHIDFDTFHQICVDALSAARRVGQVLKISGQGEDHPFSLASSEMRYLKFYHLRVHKS